MLLEIKNLHANIDGQQILKGIDLSIKGGEIHALMGPNGSGKSTLSKILAGHPDYEVTDGEIILDGESLLEMEPDVRAHKGLFLGFQYPVEVPGLNNSDFLRLAFNARRVSEGLEELDEPTFRKLIEEKMEFLDLHNEIYLERSVNDGFSGGEKKRNEILQMALLNPRLAVLDEVDSGLDIDALKVVAAGVSKLMADDKGLLLITHYQRLLEYIQPTHVHIMYAGRIVKSGDRGLALELEKYGYEAYQGEVKV